MGRVWPIQQTFLPTSGSIAVSCSEPWSRFLVTAFCELHRRTHLQTWSILRHGKRYCTPHIWIPPLQLLICSCLTGFQTFSPAVEIYIDYRRQTPRFEFLPKDLSVQLSRFALMELRIDDWACVYWCLRLAPITYCTWWEPLPCSADLWLPIRWHTIIYFIYLRCLHRFLFQREYGPRTDRGHFVSLFSSRKPTISSLCLANCDMRCGYDRCTTWWAWNSQVFGTLIWLTTQRAAVSTDTKTVVRVSWGLIRLGNSSYFSKLPKYVSMSSNFVSCFVLTLWAVPCCA